LRKLVNETDRPVDERLSRAFIEPARAALGEAPRTRAESALTRERVFELMLGARIGSGAAAGRRRSR
jgi:hypothetical protein